MKRNYRIALLLGSVFILLSGCSSITDRTGAVSVCFDGSSLCRSAGTTDSSLTVKLVDAAAETVIDTAVKTIEPADSRVEMTFSADIGSSVYLKVELVQGATVLASGVSEKITVKAATEITLSMQTGGNSTGTVTLDVPLDTVYAVPYVSSFSAQTAALYISEGTITAPAGSTITAAAVQYNSSDSSYSLLTAASYSRKLCDAAGASLSDAYEILAMDPVSHSIKLPAEMPSGITYYLVVEAEYNNIWYTKKYTLTVTAVQ
jgi:hypothetical protein